MQQFPRPDLTPTSAADRLADIESVLQVPPLAGLATYSAASAVGYSVEENVALLLRYAWIEKRAMEIALHWLAPAPEWEIKEALGLHLHVDSQHVAALRARIGEMRSPAPRMDVTCDPALDRFFDELLTARDSIEKIVGLYGVLKPALLAAYRQHYAAINPVADYPTRYMLKHILVDEEETVLWGEQAVAVALQTPEAREGASVWSEHLAVFLAAAGGDRGRFTAPGPCACVTQHYSL